jgi:DNA-binding GntR family transcriptional regulator
MKPAKTPPIPLKDQVYNAIRIKIITQQMPPGSTINERDLMAEHKIGKTPLREVLLRLKLDGLIKRFPGSCTIVSPIDFSELREAAELRVALEQLVGELAARNVTDEHKGRLRTQTAILERTLREGEYEAHILAESELHNILYQAAGNEQLRTIIVKQQSLFARLWFSLNRATRYLEAQKDHWLEMCAAFEAGDDDKIVRLNRKHFWDFYQNIKNDF